MVVKGTEFYDGKLKRYIDFPVTDILQMIGRAGRPQFDVTGITSLLQLNPNLLQLNPNLLNLTPQKAGPGDLRLLDELLSLKRRHPRRVHFILGNR